MQAFLSGPTPVSGDVHCARESLCRGKGGNLSGRAQNAQRSENVALLA